MTAGWFQDRRLQFNDTISYRCASIAPQNPTASPQLASEGPYSGKVVDFTDAGMVGVRAAEWRVERRTAQGASWSLIIIQ